MFYFKKWGGRDYSPKKWMSKKKCYENVPGWRRLETWQRNTTPDPRPDLVWEGKYGYKDKEHYCVNLQNWNSDGRLSKLITAL